MAKAPAMAWRKSPPALIALFDALLPEDARVERRKMFGYPAAFAGGKMFAGLHQDDMVAKLPEAERQRLAAEHGARPFEPTPGRRMGEFVALPAPLLADPAAARRVLTRALDYVAAAPAKVKAKGGAKRR